MNSVYRGSQGGDPTAGSIGFTLGSDIERRSAEVGYWLEPFSGPLRRPDSILKADFVVARKKTDAWQIS